MGEIYACGRFFYHYCGGILTTEVLCIFVRHQWWILLASCLKYTCITKIIINTLRPRQNGHHFADDIFKCIFLNENVWISIKISMTFVPRGPINKIPALVQIMAWRRPGDEPLSEPLMVSLTTHICVTRPQWVNEICMEANTSNLVACNVPACDYESLFPRRFTRTIINLPAYDQGNAFGSMNNITFTFAWLLLLHDSFPWCVVGN